MSALLRFELLDIVIGDIMCGEWHRNMSALLGLELLENVENVDILGMLVKCWEKRLKFQKEYKSAVTVAKCSPVLSHWETTTDKGDSYLSVEDSPGLMENVTSYNYEHFSKSLEV